MSDKSEPTVYISVHVKRDYLPKVVKAPPTQKLSQIILDHPLAVFKTALFILDLQPSHTHGRNFYQTAELIPDQTQIISVLRLHAYYSQPGPWRKTGLQSAHTPGFQTQVTQTVNTFHKLPVIWKQNGSRLFTLTWTEYDNFKSDDSDSQQNVWTTLELLGSEIHSPQNLEGVQMNPTTHSATCRKVLGECILKPVL